MRAYLKQPWAAALAATAVYLVVSLTLLLENDATEDRGSEPSAQGPDALEIAMTPLSAAFVFLAVWVVLRLMRRTSVADLDAGAERPPRSPEEARA